MTAHDDIWDLALQEAYASAPVDETILHTLEFSHPAFADGVRIVMDTGDLIEKGDPDIYGHQLNIESGELVTFVACNFNFTIPDQNEGSLPSIKITVDNVTKQISQYLEEAVNLKSPLSLTYREYLASDPTQPQYIISGLSVKEVSSSSTKVTCTAQFSDLLNKSFPKKVYRPEDFRGLLQ